MTNSFWNEDLSRRWLSCVNVGPAILDGVKTTCLVDNGAHVNLVTLEFVKARGLDVGSIQDLTDHSRHIPLSGLGGNVTEPLGYIVIRVQIPYVLSYDEDQVVLVVRDNSCFISQCPVVLGTPMINWVIWAMKESEFESAPEAWQSARYSFEYANYMAQIDPADNGITMPTNRSNNPTNLDEIVLLKNKITIPVFETTVLHCHMKKTMMMGCKLHIMTQAMYLEDRANLPNGVYVVKTYTELHDGSRNVSVVLHNLTGKLVHLAARRVVARVVAAEVTTGSAPERGLAGQTERVASRTSFEVQADVDGAPQYLLPR